MAVGILGLLRPLVRGKPLNAAIIFLPFILVVASVFWAARYSEIFLDGEELAFISYPMWLLAIVLLYFFVTPFLSFAIEPSRLILWGCVILASPIVASCARTTLNVELSNKTPRVIKATVVETFEVKSSSFRMGTSVRAFAKVTGWGGTERVRLFEVPVQESRRIQPGDRITVMTVKGYFGRDWLVGYER